ncbi:MAG: hypothetical protein PHV51_00520 [Methanosarcinaceae archaeon]|nr:hypothetical protein [Methanosarcinaceae archaeon]MDD4496630.1 hypothetical protein [Methanosarcinaceae archaeon]
MQVFIPGSFRPEPELDRLSNIARNFNNQFGTLFTDADRVARLITEELPTALLADVAYQNARQNSDRQNARIEHYKAVQRAAIRRMGDETEFFKLTYKNRPGALKARALSGRHRRPGVSGMM